MIINSGSRTDIPAYYNDWFYNRIKEEYVLVRNPYYPKKVTKYRLHPDVVDVLSFCTKNPSPMLERLEELHRFNQYWFVTINPYGKEIEPGVPSCDEVIRSTKALSKKIGPKAVGWRYDPIFISEDYSIDFHISHFEEMARELSGSVHQCVISYIDLYEKTKRNFPEVRAVTREEQHTLTKAIAEIAKAYHIPVRTCCEGRDLAQYGVDVSGCLTQAVLEEAIGQPLNVPGSVRSPREACDCLLGNDIGMYNTCPHGCVYCYANYDMAIVRRNAMAHDPLSPLLIGGLEEGDQVSEAKQVSYFDGQLRLF